MPKKAEGQNDSRDSGAQCDWFPEAQKATVRALGLHRLHETVEHKDTPALRGMLAKVIHLIQD